MSITATSHANWCTSCLEYPDRQCRSCAARRRTVIRLFEQGNQAVSEIARHMRISTAKVLRLLEEHYDRRELRRYTQSTVQARVVRDKVDAWQRQDPAAHTLAELARLAGYDSPSRVQRLLGEIPTSTVVKNGVVYPGRIQTTISPENGGRLIRALGHAPCEIEGL
jgi:hypothetical protein